MKKTNISNLLQSISVLATLRVIVNGNYSTILKHLQQKLTNYSIYYFSIYKFDYKKKKKKKIKKNSNLTSKTKNSNLISSSSMFQKKNIFESRSRESRSRKLMMERGVKKNDVTCEIAFRPIVSPYVPLMTRKKRRKKKNDKIGLHRWPKEVT